MSGSTDGPSAQDVSVRLPITLGQFLKVAGLVQTGGQAKALIQSGEVRVNGLVETRRGLGLRAGDAIEVGGRTARVTEE